MLLFLGCTVFEVFFFAIRSLLRSAFKDVLGHVTLGRVRNHCYYTPAGSELLCRPDSGKDVRAGRRSAEHTFFPRQQGHSIECILVANGYNLVANVVVKGLWDKAASDSFNLMRSRF